MSTEETRWWLWKPPEDAKYIGKSGIPRKDAKEKASGKAVYTRDIYLPGMVYAKHMTSPYACARIKSMDTSRAEKVPGVVAIIRWDDPEFKDKWPKWKLAGMEPPYFVWLMDTAYFYGHAVGAIVVAETVEACDQALKILMEDTEWEELPFNLNWDDYEKFAQSWPGYEKYSPETTDNLEYPDVTLQWGDVEAGFREADKIIEFTVRKSEEDVWAGVEAWCAIARWQGDMLEVWTNHQLPPTVKDNIAAAGVAPECNIEVYNPYKGAWFGGTTWLSGNTPLEIVCAMLAKRVKRPVKYLFDYQAFNGAEHQLGTYKFKIGVKNDGTITSVKVDTIYVSRGFGRGFIFNDPIGKVLETFKVPNVYLHSVYPLVNRNPTVCYKHGAPACTVVTMVLNRVAAELQMDPTEIALKNDGFEGHDIKEVMEIMKEQGFDTTRWSAKEVIERGKALIGWEEKWHPPGAKKLPNGKYHGIGMSFVMQWAHKPPFGTGRVGMKLNSDGTVSIYGWRGEGGFSSDVVYAQVAADEIGMRLEHVKVQFYIDKGYQLFMPAGSWGTTTNVAPVVLAARRLKKAILQAATTLSSFKGKKPEDLDIRDSMIYEKANPENKAPVSSVARSVTNVFSAGPTDFPLPQEAPHVVRQAAFVEVEVDPDTGEVEITNFAFVNDVGRALSPDVLNGQRYPYMGLGRALTEAIYYDPLTGVKLNDNLAWYDVLTIKDIDPRVIKLDLVETGLAYGAYGSSGCSEVGGAFLCTLAAPAIYNAIGKWIDDWPITPDKVLKALGKA